MIKLTLSEAEKQMNAWLGHIERSIQGDPKYIKSKQHKKDCRVLKLWEKRVREMSK